MKLNFSGYWGALFILVMIAVWLSSGEIESAADQAPDRGADRNEPLPKVAFRLLQAKQLPRRIVVQGQVEAIRSVILKSRLDTYVEAVLAENGTRVATSTLLLKLGEEDVPALITEADSQVSLARSELQAATALSARGLLADTQLKTREAALASAQAMAARFARDLQATRVEAPFAGVVEARHVETGEIVQQGDPLISLLDDSRVKLVGQVTQQDINWLSLGLPVQATLLNGQTLSGQLSFIGYQADTNLRTFRIEAELENPEFRRVIGATATLVINSALVSAHSVSPALLTLDSQGRLSIEHLAEDDRVVITPVERVQANISELWITGLPAEVRVITLGKGYVGQGEQVQAYPEEQFLRHSR